MRRPDALAERADPAEHFGQLRARHDAVLHVVVRRHAAHRGERRLAALPDARALLVVLRHFDRRGARRGGRSSSTIANSSRTSAAGPSSSTIRIVSAGGKFGWTAASAARIASASIISTAAGMMPGADDLRHGGARLADAVEGGEQRLHALGLAQNPHDRPS